MLTSVYDINEEKIMVIEHGEIDMEEPLTLSQRDLLKSDLLSYGLELMDDKKSVLIERIKNVIIEHVHYTEEQLTINFSAFLSQKLNYDYTYLANLFSDVQGITIEKFIIAHKIERVKELLVYNELNLTEIAYLMHYSSVSHLSNQFKKIEKGGNTPFNKKGLKSSDFHSQVVPTGIECGSLKHL